MSELHGGELGDMVQERIFNNRPSHTVITVHEIVKVTLDVLAENNYVALVRIDDEMKGGDNEQN